MHNDGDVSDTSRGGDALQQAAYFVWRPAVGCDHFTALNRAVSTRRGMQSMPFTPQAAKTGAGISGCFVASTDDSGAQHVDVPDGP